MLIWNLTGSVLGLGVIAAAVALPIMFVNVFGGVLADRFEARNILGGSSFVGTTLLATLGVLDLNGIVEPWHVITIAILSGLVAGADQPSLQAYFPSIASASVVAPTLGGLLIAATATHIGFFVADGGWIAMFIATLFLPRRRSSPEQRSVIRELATGFRFIRGHRVLMFLTFSNMLMGFGWIGLLPAYVDQFGGGAREVGFVFSSAGIGALSGIVVAGRCLPGSTPEGLCWGPLPHSQRLCCSLPIPLLSGLGWGWR